MDRHATAAANEEARIWILLSLEIWNRVAFQGHVEPLRMGGRAHSLSA